MAKKATAPAPQLPPDLPRVAGQITVKLGDDVHGKLVAIWQKWLKERTAPITMSDTLRAVIVMVYDLEILTPLELAAGVPQLPAGVNRVSFPAVVADAIDRAERPVLPPQKPAGAGPTRKAKTGAGKTVKGGEK